MRSNKNTLLSYPRFRVFLWLFYLILIGYTGFHHEPISDEIDTWLMTRDATLWEFLTYFSYSGHPPLWYLLNLPFSRWLGLPIEAQQMLPFFLASGVSWLLLFRSPFPLWLLVPCLFSHHMLFQYGVTIRGYTLLIFLMLFIAVLHPSRFERPYRYVAVIALLLLTEMFAWPVAGVVMLFFMQDIRSRWSMLSLNERKRYVIASVIPVVSAALAVLSVWPMPDAGYGVTSRNVGFPLGIFVAMSYGFIPFKILEDLPGVHSYITEFFSGIGDAAWYNASIFLFTFALPFFFQRRRVIWLFAAWFGGFYVIISFVYAGVHWHWQLIPLYLLFTVWFARVDRPAEKKHSFGFLHVVLAVTFGVSVPIGVLTLWHDIRYPYSGAPETAQFIEEQVLPKNAVVIGIGCEKAISVAGRLPLGAVWLDVRQDFARFHRWNRQMYECRDKTDYTTMVTRSLARFTDKKEVWLFSDRPIEKAENFGLTQGFVSSETMSLFWRERYWVYRRE